MSLNRHYNGTEFITGLRSVAVLMVFLIHSGGGGLRSLGNEFNMLVDWGKHGVSMFFVISGFTIFHQILARQYTFKKFILVRLARISLPYWPLLLLLYFYSTLITGTTISRHGVRFNNGEISIDNLLAHLTYFSSFSINYQNTIISVEWTLAIEVFYYATLGLILTSAFFKQTSASFYLILGIALFAIYNVAIGLMNHNNFIDPMYIHWSPIKYGFMFLLGGAVYFIRKDLGANYPKKHLDIVSNISFMLAIVIVFINLRYPVFQNIELFFALITFMLLTFTRDTSKLTFFLTNKIMIFTGSISFSFYLWHLVVLNEIRVYFPEIYSNEQHYLIYSFIITVIISTTWYLFFERYLYKKLKFKINQKIRPETATQN